MVEYHDVRLQQFGTFDVDRELTFLRYGHQPTDREARFVVSQCSLEGQANGDWNGQLRQNLVDRLLIGCHNPVFITDNLESQGVLRSPSNQSQLRWFLDGPLRSVVRNRVQNPQDQTDGEQTL